MKSVDKKGEITIGTIITIVLAVAVLVLLIWGFSTNWSFFSGVTSGRLGSSNAEAVVSACQLACDTGSKADYCSNPRTLKLGEKKSITLSNGTVQDRDQITGTCDALSKHQITGVAIPTCSMDCVTV